MRAGITAAATITVGDFDSHARHEEISATLMPGLTDAITYAYDFAGELGILGRLTIIVTSESFEHFKSISIFATTQSSMASISASAPSRCSNWG